MLTDRENMKKLRTFKILGKKVGIANTSFRKKKEFERKERALSLDTKAESETQKKPLSPKKRLLSPLPTLVSKFIAENARKTLDSIEDKQEKRDFVSDLCETLKSVRDGKKRPPRRTLSPPWGVIIFFADTTESTLGSIADEEERSSFTEHLTRSLRQSFEQDILMR